MSDSERTADRKVAAFATQPETRPGDVISQERRADRGQSSSDAPRIGDKGSVRRVASRLWSNHTVLVGLLLLLGVFFYTQNSIFLTGLNLQNLASQGSVLVMMAEGQLFVILIGGLDISVGAQLSLVAICATKLSLIMPLAAVYPIALLIGASVGVANGLLVTWGRVSPIIATLATSQVIIGGLLVWTGGFTYRNFSSAYGALGGNNIGPIPASAFLAGAVVILTWFLLRRTSFGRYTYAVGGNAEAARLSGIGVGVVTAWTYVVCSLFTALAAVTLSSRVGSGVEALGIGLEVTTLAAVFIGGVAWGGGAGTALGALLGALLITVIQNGFDLMSVSSDIQTVVTGVLIAISVAIAARTKAGASA